MRCWQQLIFSLRARLAGGNRMSFLARFMVAGHICPSLRYNTAKTSSRRKRFLTERISRELSFPFQTSLVL